MANWIAGPGSGAAVWAIAALATLGVILRPFRWPEAVWACLGAALLVGLGLLPAVDAWTGVRRGTDVYLFLVGMMLLAEVARREALFGWLAGFAVRAAGGSGTRLFALLYAVGVGVTALLSNDATAVVLTPAVFAAARAAGAPPLPHLFACALVANAASFVLPISNPANLVVYAGQVPPLGEWLRRFALPSLAAILATYAVLRLRHADALRRPVAASAAAVPLGRGGRIAALGIVATAAVLIWASAGGHELGPPTFAAGVGTALAVLLATRQGPAGVLSGVSWSVLPLVAGLFVLVQALEGTGAVRELAASLRGWAAASPDATAWGSGIVLAVATNLVNNLPAGLLAGSLTAAAGASPDLAGAVLIGIDLGPNLSVTGSLATILWLSAIRREGMEIGALDFLRLGLVAMPPALLLALAALIHSPFAR